MWTNVGRQPGAIKYDFLFFYLSAEDRVFLFKSQKFLTELQGTIGVHCHVVYQFVGCENKLSYYVSCIACLF
jgi:hypothetical protein